MANRYWDGGASTDPININNWSDTDGGATPASSVPGVGDHALFTTNGDGNACTLTAHWALGNLTVQAGYTSKIDLSTFNLTMDDSGDILLSGGGEFDHGTGIISLTNGDFNFSAQTTWTGASGTLQMGGTGILTRKTGKQIRNLIIDAGGAITTPNSLNVGGICTLNGTLNIVGNFYIYGNVVVGPTGRLTGAAIALLTPGPGEGIGSFAVGGIIDIAELQIFRPDIASVFAPGVYDSALVHVINNAATSQTLTFSATPTTPYTFTGNLEFENSNAAGSLTIANNTNNPDIIIQGDVIRTETAGTITYIKGSGTLTVSGGDAQSLDFNGSIIEDFIVSKTSGTTVTLASDLDSDSFTGVSGVFDSAGFNVVAVNDMDWGNGFVLSDLVGSYIIVGGDWSAYGQDLIASGEWFLQVTGTTFAGGGNGSVIYSNADGYIEVRAPGWTTLGNNSNWNFASLSGMRAFLEDLMGRRGNVTVGGNPVGMIAELHGGDAVELTAFEPDPATYRQPFYYNTVINCLYKRVVTERSVNGNIAYWQKVSL